MVDLDAGRDRVRGEHRAHRRVDDLVDLLHQLDARIDDAVLVLEERRQLADGDVAVLVDRGAEHGAAMLAIPFRIVGAAAEQRKPERGAADDHSLEPSLKNAGASASEAGVPMTMNRAWRLAACRVASGSRLRKSLSSDGPVEAASRASSVGENA